MSTVVTKNVQVGDSSTVVNNFTLYQPTTPDGTLRIANGNSGSTTDLVTLTSNGNIGLGVTPSAWATYKVLQVNNGAVSNLLNAATVISQNWYWNGSANVYINDGFATQYIQQSGFHRWTSVSSGTAGTTFATTELMRLDASGNLGIGLNNPSEKLHVTGNILATGNITALSDERLKTDWQELSTTFLQDITKIKSGTFTRIDTNERQAGVSAQDVQRILPEVVINSSTTLSLAYGNLAMVTVVELTKKVLELENKINQLLEKKV